MQVLHNDASRDLLSFKLHEMGYNYNNIWAILIGK